MELLVDRYRRDRSLGRGAMGEVWLAEDTLLGRPVAIKQLRTDPDATLGQWGERMRREARLAAQLNHPNAVAIYDLIIVEDQPYVVMEYVPGDSLARRIRSAGKLPPEQAGRWIGQVAAALEAAHARGIVHRDVKPANILITPEDSAKLADFGIARSVQDVSQTQTGVMVGTPAFLAPEVARGGDPSPASDVWSLGATLYAAIEGKAPFGSGLDNPLALLARIGSEPVPAAPSAGSLTPILEAMLERDPSRRPTAAQVRAGLAYETPAPGERTGPVAAETDDVDQTQMRQHPTPPPGPVALPPPPLAGPSGPHWPTGPTGPPPVYLPPVPGYGYGEQPPPPPRRRNSGWLVAGILISVLVIAGGVIAAVALSSSKSKAQHDPTTTAAPSPTSSPSSSPDFPSTSENPTTTSAISTTTTPTPKPTPTTRKKPAGVPGLPSSGQAVPTNATPPRAPSDPAVRPYTSPNPTPTTAKQIVEWQPPGLSGDGAAAVSAITQFLADINRQDMQNAWTNSTEIRHGASPDAKFTTGYRTSRHYQVAFGQPRRLDADLIAVPARFVSRQDPAAQGNPSGVTGCTYWPQYVFLVAKVNGRWLDDVAGDYTSRSSVASLKRHDTVRGGQQLLPLQQRVAC
ncbi:MAG TPA: serine/threonine-protein kinase [Jatrophihabitantaceae bacterium]